MRVRAAARGGLLALALALAPVHAGAADELPTARAAFEYGDYEKALSIAEGMLASGALTREEELVEALRIAGLCHFYSRAPDRLQKAEAAFLRLLSVDPDSALDPFFTPPQAVAFFDEVRGRYEAELEPIREQRRRVKEALRQQEELRRRITESAEREARGRAGATKVREVERRHFPLVLLPFGIGQVQNGEASKGVLLAMVQGVAGVASAASWVALAQMEEPNGGFASSELELASSLEVLKLASAGVFYAAWGYGVVDAWIGFQPEVVREYELPAARATPAGRAPAAVGPEGAAAPAQEPSGAEGTAPRPDEAPGPVDTSPPADEVTPRPVETPSATPPSPVSLAPLLAPTRGGGLFGILLRF